MVWRVSKHGPNYLKGDYVENKTQGWRDPWMECLLYRHETMSSDPQQLPCVDDNVPYPQHARVETDWSWHLWLANLATLGVLGSGKTMSRKNNVKEWLRKIAWCTSGLYIGLMHPHHKHPPHTHTHILISYGTINRILLWPQYVVLPSPPPQPSNSHLTTHRLGVQFPFRCQSQPWAVSPTHVFKDKSLL